MDTVLPELRDRLTAAAADAGVETLLTAATAERAPADQIESLVIDAGAGIAGEGPADEIGELRASLLSQPGARLAIIGFRLARSLLASNQALEVESRSAATGAIEDVAFDLDWIEHVPWELSTIGDQLISEEADRLGESEDDDALSALSMSFDLGVAFAIAEAHVGEGNAESTLPVSDQ